MDPLGIEPWAFRMQSRCDTTTPRALEKDVKINMFSNDSLVGLRGGSHVSLVSRRGGSPERRTEAEAAEAEAAEAEAEATTILPDRTPKPHAHQQTYAVMKNPHSDIQDIPLSRNLKTNYI